MSPLQKKNIVGLSREELKSILGARSDSALRIKQLWHWIYFRGAKDFSEMTTLSKTLRGDFEHLYSLFRPSICSEQSSVDGTTKWLLKTFDNKEIETVFIPEHERGALCISTQIGCTLNCSFCYTGTQKLVRNLTASEIVGQLLVARDACNDWSSTIGKRKVSNIVVMGMGEPLYNYKEVANALRIIMDPEGIGISKRRITLSTSGVVPMIHKVGEELGVGLAISLHAVTDNLRDKLVPINRKYPIKELLEACRTYPGASNARRITFEYVMLENVNDSPADARQLVRLLKGINAKVNLIPFNGWPSAPFKCSRPNVIKAFSRILNENNLSSPIRVPRGRDIMAACGQLKSASKANK